MRDTQRRAIAGFFAETMLDLEDVLKGTTQLLSRVTQYASVAVPPSGSSEVVAPDRADRARERRSCCWSSASAAAWTRR